MKRHYRVWLRSADGLEGKKGIVALPGDFRPTMRTFILGRIKGPWTELSKVTPDDLDFKVSTREYEFWKAEGRKLWYREVVP